ncbi:MAG: hypothetical protein C4291_07880 [Candidatus Dadabacteria bacterium]
MRLFKTFLLRLKRHYFKDNPCDCPRQIHRRRTLFNWPAIDIGLLLQVLIWIMYFPMLLFSPLETFGETQTPTDTDETSKEIERLKSEIREMKEEYEKKIDELNRHIEEIELKNRKNMWNQVSRRRR